MGRHTYLVHPKSGDYPSWLLIQYLSWTANAWVNKSHPFKYKRTPWMLSHIKICMHTCLDIDLLLLNCCALGTINTGCILLFFYQTSRIMKDDLIVFYYSFIRLVSWRMICAIMSGSFILARYVLLYCISAGVRTVWSCTLQKCILVESLNSWSYHKNFP